MNANELNHIFLFFYVGAGHIEMNLVRTVFAEFFCIYIKPVAVMLGFVTPKSLEYCKAAADYHKSWQILQVHRKNRQ